MRCLHSPSVATQADWSRVRQPLRPQDLVLSALARRWQWTISLWKNQGLTWEQAEGAAKDADEVGALWINVLLQRVVAPVKREVGARVVVIGHSFGAAVSVYTGGVDDRVAAVISCGGSFGSTVRQ